MRIFSHSKWDIVPVMAAFAHLAFNVWLIADLMAARCGFLRFSAAFMRFPFHGISTVYRTTSSIRHISGHAG